MSTGLARSKSKLPNPSSNTKNTGKQDYMMEAMAEPHAKAKWYPKSRKQEKPW